MPRRLSEIGIAKLKPRATRFEIGDTTELLKLVIQPSGHRSFALRYRLAGKPVKLTLGDHPALTLEAARDAAVEARKLIRQGIDPATLHKPQAAPEPVPAPVVDTVERVVERFIAEYLGDRANVRATTAAVTAPALRKATEGWRGRPITGITRKDVKEAIATAKERGPSAAIKSRMTLSRFFAWAIEQDIIETSPAVSLGKMPTTAPRQRVLADSEIVRIWKGTETVEPWLKVFVRVLLLTAGRRNEVAGLRWSEIDGTDWVLPAERSKNGQPHLIPLPGTVVDLIDSMPRVGAFVFSSDGLTHRQSFDKAKDAIDRAIELDGAGPMTPWVFHDLRRGAASGMAKLGVSADHIERLLNHGVARLRGTYQIYDFRAEKRAALTIWEQHCLAIVEGRTSSVLAFGRSA